MKEHRPTLEAVAARARVGRGTASRVINGSGHVSPESRAAVLRAVEELGYVPNSAARALVRQRTDTVAFVAAVTDDRGFWEDPFYSPLVRGASAALAAEGIQLLLAIAQSRQEHAQLTAFLSARHVDGVLLSSLHEGDPLLGRLDASAVPTVLVGAPAGYTPAYGVDVDNAAGGRLAAHHLIERGRRRIAVITGPLSIRASIDRWHGFRAVLDEAGLAHGPVAQGDFSRVSGEEAVRQLLAGGEQFDALFAANDLMAAAAVDVLRESGRTVPDDVAVVGFDDTWVAAAADPPLTSIHQPLEDMGREAALLLLARLRQDDVPEPNVLFTPRLVVRESA
ncbi:LacI family transcriptional regulator [Streptomyces sp. YC504]|uniref:LacI family transcriptional regulator n=1 Tax=Streptomyces mesophilus TaxID=1775132 RepID=A0A6G4X9P2_9ACTN|nr:LacI family DNA-binding transcriptional regulator [Streptomyces mesophilus]NGO74098.1 LacI family transcriptional regulator [Streptomyces mesophilus]